jgi:hypothetical protein
VYTAPVDWGTEGPHSFGYYSIDNLDQVESASTDGFIVDNTPPMIQSFYATNPLFSPDGNGVKDNTTIVFNATDNLATEFNELEYWIFIRDSSNSIVRSLHTLTTSGEGEQMLWDGDGLPDGNYTVELIVQDAIGYNDTETIQVVIDTTAPTMGAIFVGQSWIRVGVPFYVEAVTSDNNGFDGNDCAITVVDQLNVDSFAGYIDYSTMHGRCRGYATLTEPLENGFGSINLTVEDAAGNRNYGAYNIGIDTIVSGPNMTVMLDEYIVKQSQLVTFNISVDPEDMSGFDGFCYVRLGELGWEQYTMDTNGVCNDQFIIPDIADGSYAFEAGLKDNVGNWNTTDNTTVLMVDGTGPSQERFAPLGQYYSSVLPVNISVTDTPAGVNDTTVVARIYHVGLFGFKIEDVPTVVLTHVTNTSYYTQSFNISMLGEDTQYYFSYKSADMLGNENTSDWNSVPFGIDNSPPVWPISASLSVTNSPYDKDGNLDLSWPAATDAKSGIQYYQIYVNGVLNTTVNATNFSFADLPDGVYAFAVRPVDVVGNVGESLSRSTTVDRTCTYEGTRCRASGGGGSGGGAYTGGSSGDCSAGYTDVNGACVKNKTPTVAPPSNTGSDLQETGSDTTTENADGTSDNGVQTPAPESTSTTPPEGNLLTGNVAGAGLGASLWWLIALGALILVGLGYWFIRRK